MNFFIGILLVDSGPEADGSGLEAGSEPVIAPTCEEDVMWR
jgi:hypothetical protein